MALGLVGAVHAGFSLVVTVLVYPALADAGSRCAAGGDRAGWSTLHARHSRRIVGLVALLYGALLAAGGWVLVSGPTPAAWVALAGAGGAMALTALGAAPIHGALDEPDPGLLARLLVVDRLRTAAAVAGAVAGAVLMW